MSQLGRLLVLTAQYYAYTGDASLLLRHEAKLAGIAQLLRGRRQSALAAFPAGNRRDCLSELAAACPVSTSRMSLVCTIISLRLGRRFLSASHECLCG